MADSSNDKLNAILDILGACLLGFATITSAWAGYQATVWGGNSQVSFIKGSNMLNEGNSRFLLGVQMMMLDGNMYLQSTSQLILGMGLKQPTRMALSQGIEQTMQKDFKKYVNWAKAQYQKTGKAHDPFAHPGYMKLRLGEAEAMRKKSNTFFKKGQKESSVGDNYILTVVFFSIVLFFAGMASVMRQQLIKIVFLGASLGTFIYACIKLFGLPIA